MFLHHQKVLWIKNFWAVFFSTKGALRRHPDPTYPFLALNQLNRPQKLASGHGQSPINYELRWNCHCNIFAAFDKYLLWNILIFVLYIRIWHGDLNLRYQSKGNHGGEVNVCQEFQLALAGAPDSSYKSSKKSIPFVSDIDLSPEAKKCCPVHPCCRPWQILPRPGMKFLWTLEPVNYPLKCLSLIVHESLPDNEHCPDFSLQYFGFLSG